MASGPWDNVSLPSPPNGPAYLQAWSQLANTGSNLVNNAVNAYQKGQEFQYQQNQRNFFQDPNNQQLLSQFIQQPSQQNYASLLQKMAQAGGMQAAGPLIDQYLGMTQDASIAKRIGGTGQPTNPAAPEAGGPANIVGPNTGSRNYIPSQTTGNSRYSNPATIDDPNNPGGETVQSLAGAIARGLGISDVPPSKIANYARSLGVSPDQPLDEQKERRAREIIGNNLRAGRAASRGSDNLVQPSGPGEQEASSNQLNPSSVQGGQQISPVPTSGSGKIPARVAQAPAATFNDRFGASGDRSGERPSPLGDMAKVRSLNREIADLQATAAEYSRRAPKAAEQADKAAEAKIKERDRILESISKYNEPGRIQRDVESGATLTAEQIRSDTERYGKKYDALQNSKDQAHQMLSTNSVTRSIMDNPDFYSGTGAEHVLALKRLAVALGLKGPDAAMPMEVFGKTVSSAILDQIRSLGGQGLGQVRVAEINVMKQAAQNHDNTVSSNRLLTEIQDRLAKRWTIPIAEAAEQYKGGHLDAGFDRWKTDHINNNPLFSEDELKDVRRIAPPLVRTPADLKKIGWKDGDPFRTPDGRILTHMAQ